MVIAIASRAGTACENNCASNFNYCKTMIGNPAFPKLTLQVCESIYNTCMEVCAEQ